MTLARLSDRAGAARDRTDVFARSFRVRDRSCFSARLLVDGLAGATNTSVRFANRDSTFGHSTEREYKRLEHLPDRASARHCQTRLAATVSRRRAARRTLYLNGTMEATAVLRLYDILFGGTPPRHISNRILVEVS